MHTTAAVLMLAFGAMAADAQEWTSDYGAALKVARAENRPLLIVIEDAGQPAVRAEQVKQVAAGAGDALLAPYVLCRVDVGTEYGRKVAASFRATRTPHVVITDRGARRQIFQRSGRMASSEWRATLTTYRTGRRPAPPPVWQPAWQPEICRT